MCSTVPQSNETFYRLVMHPVHVDLRFVHCCSVVYLSSRGTSVISRRLFFSFFFDAKEESIAITSPHQAEPASLCFYCRLGNAKNYKERTQFTVFLIESVFFGNDS